MKTFKEFLQLKESFKNKDGSFRTKVTPSSQKLAIIDQILANHNITEGVYKKPIFQQ